MCTSRRRTLSTKLSAHSLDQQAKCEFASDEPSIVASISESKRSDLSMPETRDSLSGISKILRLVKKSASEEKAKS